MRKESKAKPKKIIPIMEDDQQSIKDYNERTSKTSAQIPLVPRNKETGWPLMQIGMLSLNKHGLYETTLGGGRCHDLSLGHYFFALLLKQIKIGELITDKIGDDIYTQIHTHKTFEVTFKNPAMVVSMDQGPYGYMCRVALAGMDVSRLDDALGEITKTAAPGIDFILPWNVEASYTEEEILKHIDPSYTVFKDGRFYVDFGELLKKAGVDKEVTEFFEGIFRVYSFKKEFQANPKEKNEKDKSALQDLHLLSPNKTDSKNSDKGKAKDKHVDKYPGPSGWWRF